ncbi:MAG: hypothetical protein WAM90_01365 [Rhodanobacter sp.]
MSLLGGSCRRDQLSNRPKPLGATGMAVPRIIYHVGAELPEPGWLSTGDAMTIRGSLYRAVFEHLLFRVEESNCLQ